MAGNKQANNVDNPAAQSMKMMNYVMPIMSMFFCAMLPICVGLYWVASAVFGTLQTVFINRYMDKVDVDDLMAANAAKERDYNRFPDGGSGEDFHEIHTD